MNKIKDLATVLLDNAVLFFPVDSERYELAAAVRNYVALLTERSFDGPCFRPLYEHGNWRVNEWLSAADELIRVGAKCYESLLLLPDELSDLDRDRGRRVSAIIHDYFGDSFTVGEKGEGLLEPLYRFLWCVVARRMRYSTLFVEGSSPRLEEFQ